MEIDVQHIYGGYTDSERWRIAKDLLEFFIPDEPRKDLTDPRVRAEEWLLEEKGFEEVEWAQPSDDILLCLLWRFREGRLVDEFIIEFSGHDAAIVSLFCLTKSEGF